MSLPRSASEDTTKELRLLEARYGQMSGGLWNALRKLHAVDVRLLGEWIRTNITLDGKDGHVVDCRCEACSADSGQRTDENWMPIHFEPLADECGVGFGACSDRRDMVTCPACLDRLASAEEATG